jgi:hypothetical protein
LRTNILFPSLYRARTLISNRLYLASVAFDRSQISYLWIFDDTIDWNMKTAMAGIIAAALWLTCSLCYMGYVFYNFCGAHNTNARLEESEDDESVPRKPGKVDLDSLERTEGNIH